MSAGGATARAGGEHPARCQFVGGKGGVGKTTLAAALAIRAATEGARTLVVSTDPAPSLGDALGVRLGRQPRRVPLRRGTLHAVEVEATSVIREWMSTRSSRLREIALRGTWLDADDVDELLGLTLPGIDELAGLLEVLRLNRSGRYDLIVVDTAPTGHTLRMLAMPDTLARVADLFDAMQDKHRAIVAALRGRWVPDAADHFVRALGDDARELKALIRDRDRTSVTWVSLAERLAVEETIDAVRFLIQGGMPVEGIVLNRLIPERSGCSFCRRRRHVQLTAAAMLRRRLPSVAGRSLAVSAIAEQSTEPTSVAALQRLTPVSFHVGPRVSGRNPDVVIAATSGIGGGAVTRGRSKASRAASLEDLLNTPLLWFGGKGGVGKTTCAAAMALSFASASPSRRILLLSADPAHSLGDALRAPVSNDPRPIPGGPANLAVRELDVARALEEARAEYASAVDDLFDRIGSSNVDASYDRRVMHGLLDLAPPGLDELVAVLEVTALMAGETPSRWDQVIVDMAPTGHALRLLEMPALIHDWTHALMRIVLKYQPVVGAGRLGQLLITLARRIGVLRRMLTDPVQTRFVVVTRAAALPRAETLRLKATLEKLGIDVPAIVVNAVGQGTCAACRSARAAERRELTLLTAGLRRRDPVRVLLAPAQVPAPEGRTSLKRWRQTWAEKPA